MKNLIFTLFGLLILAGCNKTDNGPQISSYPIAAGNEWTYDRELTFTKYESDNMENVIESDTVDNTVRTWIEKDTLMNDTMSVKKFRAHEIDSEVYETEFLYTDAEGVKCYAYYRGSGLMAFVKKQVGFKFPHSIPFGGLFTVHKSKTDKLVYEVPPTLNLKMPLVNNIIWTYRLPSEELPVQIDKRVVTAESVKVPAGSFECFKIKYKYSNDSIFDNVNVHEWIAKEGLIKRQINMDPTVYTNQEGDSVWIGKSTETYSLKALDLN